MRKYGEMTREEQKEVAELFANWLKPYSKTVIVSVMEKSDEILNNYFAMSLLKELSEREQKETEEFSDNIEMLFRNFDGFKQYNPHNYCITHSDSYRDILYDMYIAKIKEDKNYDSN